MEFGGHHPLLGHLVMKHSGHKDLAELASLARIESETGTRATFVINLLPHHPPIAALPPRRECVGPPPPGGKAAGHPRPPPPRNGAGGVDRPTPLRAHRATQRGALWQMQRGGASRQSELGCWPSRCQETLR